MNLDPIVDELAKIRLLLEEINEKLERPVITIQSSEWMSNLSKQKFEDHIKQSVRRSLLGIIE